MSDEYRWVSNADAKIKFELPASWTDKEPTEDLPPNSRITMSPDNRVSLEYTWITQGAPEAAQDERKLLDILKTKVSAVEVTRPASTAIQNGLQVFGIAGRGKINEAYAEWVFLTFGDRMGKGLLINIMAIDGMRPKQDIITRITMSVQPLEEAPAAPSGS